MSIKEKLESEVYGVSSAPFILKVDGLSYIYINRKGCYPDEKEAFEGNDLEEDHVITNKFVANANCSDFNFSIAKVKTCHFESREIFDKLSVTRHQEVVSKLSFNKISIKNVMEKFGVTVSCNMEYYSKNLNELVTDLGRNISDVELSDSFTNKKLEEELFYKLMSNLIGEIGEDNLLENGSNREYILKEFHIFYCTFNTIIGTCKKGNYYLYFLYLE